MLECLVLVGLSGRLSLTSLLVLFFFFPLRRDNSGKKTLYFFPHRDVNFPRPCHAAASSALKRSPGTRGAVWWHLGTSNEVLVVCFWGWESPKTPHPAPSELLAQLGVYK